MGSIDNHSRQSRKNIKDSHAIPATIHNCGACNQDFKEPNVHSRCGQTFCKECVKPGKACSACHGTVQVEDVLPAPKLVIQLLEKVKVSVELLKI